MGFLVDFWWREARGEALAVETAEYGAIGSRLFGFPLHKGLLEDCEEIRGRAFDIVHASEVIEHVPEPEKFVRLLIEHLSPGGTLVLTTPAAEYVLPENDGPDLAAALSPGFHGFLFSAGALRSLLQRCGFEHVEVRAYSQRLIAWASRRPLAIDDQNPLLRQAYFGYLTSTLDRPGVDEGVWQSYAYRYIRDQVNLGRLDEAAHRARELTRRLAKAWGERLLDYRGQAQRYAVCEPTWRAIGSEGPYFMPVLFYSLGMLELLLRRDAVEAEQAFLAAESSALLLMRVNGACFLEAAHILWPARAMRAHANVALRQFGEAGRLWCDLAGAAAAPGPHDRGLLGPQFVEGELQKGCLTLVSVGAFEAARAVLDALAAYQHTLRESETDPFFVDYCAALLCFKSGDREAGMRTFEALGHRSQGCEPESRWNAVVSRYLSELSVMARQASTPNPRYRFY